MSNYYRPNRFPPVVKNLIIINVLVFIIQEMFGQTNPVIDNLFALHDYHSDYFRPHQLLTYMFMHGGFGHIFSNMLGLFVFGAMLENVWGAKRFLQFYVICGVAAGLLHLVILYFQMESAWRAALPEITALNLDINEVKKQMFSNPSAITIGASGAVFGCLAGCGMLFPNTEVYLYFAIPVKIKWLVIVYGAYELFTGVQNSAGDNVAHFAHIGGAVAGVIIVLIWNKKNRRSLY